MKIAYFNHRNRFNYEYNWFSRFDLDKIKFIDTNFDRYPKEKPSNVEYCKVDFRENKFLNKFFHSSAAIVEYIDFEKYLEDINVVIVLEAFSSISKQIIKYCKSKKIKVIVLVYELIPSHPVYFLPFYSSKYILKNADKFVCVSDAAKQHLIKLGLEKSKAEVIYPGIDLGIFKNDPEKHLQNNIVFVGNLNKNKGIDLVISAFEQLQIKYKNLELTVIGDGEFKDFVMSKSHENKSIKYLGRVDNQKLPQYLNQGSIYVLPCTDTYKYGIKIGAEQFGFSLVEAMACGLAVITTDCGAVGEIVTTNNYILPQEDIAAIVTSLDDLLKNPNKSKLIGTKNVDIAQEKYNIDLQSKQFCFFLKACL